MAIEVSQNEEISGGGKNGGRKGVSSFIQQRRADRGSINIKEVRAAEAPEVRAA